MKGQLAIGALLEQDAPATTSPRCSGDQSDARTDYGLAPGGRTSVFISWKLMLRIHCYHALPLVLMQQEYAVSGPYPGTPISRSANVEAFGIAPYLHFGSHISQISVPVSPFQGSSIFFTLLPRAHLLSSSSRGGSTWAKPCQASGLDVAGVNNARPPALVWREFRAPA